jgi:hypothetical protein
MVIVEAPFQGVMNQFEEPLMKILMFAAFLFGASHACAQAPDAAAGDQAMADHLARCASAQVSMIMTLKRYGKPVDDLYATAGYFKAAAQAYSSQEYAERRFEELRESARKKELDALAGDDSTRPERARLLASEIWSEVAACVAYQRENVATLNARLKSAAPQ